MKNMIKLLMAIALIFGFTSCINEELKTTEGDIAKIGVLSYSLDILDEPVDGNALCRKNNFSGMGCGMPLDALNLTEDQWAAVKEIMQDCRRKCMPPMNENGSKPTFMEMKAMHKDMRDSLLKRIIPILNTEQALKLNSITGSLENGKVPPELIDAKIARLTDNLDLTEEQQGRLKEIFTVSMQKIMDIRESSEDPKPAFAVIKTIHEETREKVEYVLTDEQLAKFEELRFQRKSSVDGKPCNGGFGMKKDCRKDGSGMKNDCRKDNSGMKKDCSRGGFGMRKDGDKSGRK